jgi:dienelactone hydrolase
MTSRSRRAWWVVAVLLVAAGAAILVTSVGGVSRTEDRAGATPLRIVRPDGPATVPAGAVVLAHGFSGSAAMVDPLASALARAGLLVVMPDLPGHGGNAAILAEGSLEPAVGAAVAYAADASGLPVAVAGHSMGAGAVTSWATAQPAEATVAISLPSADDLPADPGRPRNLLLLWGSAEQARFVEAAVAGLQRGYPDGEPGRTYGDPGAGTARRAVEVAGAEHIGVLYRAQTAREIAAWLDAPGEPTGDLRWVGLLLVLAGGLVACRPLVAAGPVGGPPVVDPSVAGGPVVGGPVVGGPVVGGPVVSGRPVPAPAPRVLPTIGWFALAVVVAGVVARAVDVAGSIPVAVAGYLMVWFAGGATVLLAAAGRRGSDRGSLRGLVRGCLAGVVLTLCLALPARVTWAAFEVVGPRAWVLAALLGVLGAWLWAEARLTSGATGWRRALLLAVSRVLLVGGLLGAVVLLAAPGFLTLTIPLVVPILALLAVVGFWAADPAAAAAAQAIPLAVAIATTFPLVG